jgi:hypothetical protein
MLARLPSMLIAQPRIDASSSSIPIPTSLAATRYAFRATITPPASACWHARIMSSGASVASRIAAWSASRRAPFSGSVALGSFSAAITARYASLSRSISSISDSRKGRSRDDASARSVASSGAIVRVFGRPAAIISSETPSEPASAAAAPPPGTGSFDANASSRSMTANEE